jgi:FixJ family two-component response regulator
MGYVNQGQLEELRHHRLEIARLQAESEESLAQLEDLIRDAKSFPSSPASGVPIVHVVDDDEGFATGICRLLRASGYSVRSYANAGDFLLAQIPDAPGCILLDLCLPGPSGLDLQCALASRGALLPIIFLSGCADIPTSVRAMKGGAIDFLTKPVERQTLLQAVRNGIARSQDNRLLRDQLRDQRTRYEKLTRRETEVFERVVAGKMNKEIASELGAAERTIKAHRAQVMQKMQVSSVAELVHIAAQLQRADSAGASPPA